MAAAFLPLSLQQQPSFSFRFFLFFLSVILSSVTCFVHQNGVHAKRRSSFPRWQLQSRLFETSSSSSTLTTTSSLSPSSSSAPSQRKDAAGFYEKAVRGPPLETKPDYESITGPFGKGVDNLFMTLFRNELETQVGITSSLPDTDYQAIIELAQFMNRNVTDRLEVQQRAQMVLCNLFPAWLPGSYAVLFSKPFPTFSARMNAWATQAGGTWLMGECEVNDVPVDGGKIGYKQGLLVQRCRFLEEAGCASVCVNSCKIPTQNFFMQNMGLPLTMEPNYETFECQFSFGRTPDVQSEWEAKNIPCLARCPTAGALRKWHDDRASGSLIDTDTSATKSPCTLMENK